MRCDVANSDVTAANRLVDQADRLTKRIKVDRVSAADGERAEFQAALDAVSRLGRQFEADRRHDS